jgi:hypothetical protein
MRGWPFALVAAVAIAVALLWTGAARADEGASVSPQVASHAARIEGERVTWESSFIDNGPVDPAARWERIDLARPIAGELDAVRSPGVAAIVDGKGAILGFAVDARRVPNWHDAVTVTVRAPLTRAGGGGGGGDVVLAPPLARGDSVQRIVVSGEGDLRFEPDPGLGVVHHVGSWSAPSVSEDARRETDARLEGGHAALDLAPIYVLGSSPAFEQGLRGRALTATERARPGLILAVLVFVLLAGASAAAYRWLGHDARIEQAEAVLKQEFESDQSGG